MFPVLKTITILLLTAALNLQAVVMPGSCECQGTAWTTGSLCTRTTPKPTRSCCAGRKVQAENVASPRTSPLPVHPACICCPSQRTEGVQDKTPSVDRSELVVAILPAPESPIPAVRVTDCGRLARIWQDDTHGIARQALLSVWRN